MTSGERIPEAPEEHPSLTRLKNRLASFGFACLATEWKGQQAAYTFVCPLGHAFQRNAGAMNYGTSSPLCPACERAASYKRLLVLAGWRGGKCLETDFLGSQTLHRMRCAKGHEWQALGARLLTGHWCPLCAKETPVSRRRARKTTS